MNRNIIIGLCLCITSLAGCVKVCYRCTEMKAVTQIYVKDTDTVKIVQIGNYVDFYLGTDSFVAQGYSRTVINGTIPVDIDYCRLKKDKKNDYYESCTKVLINP